jgi:hypothetical protein
MLFTCSSSVESIIIIIIIVKKKRKKRERRKRQIKGNKTRTALKVRKRYFKPTGSFYSLPLLHMPPLFYLLFIYLFSFDISIV